MQAQSQGAVLSLVFLWVVAIGYAHAGQSAVFSTGTFSGSVVNTDSDTNGDGLEAGLFSEH